MKKKRNREQRTVVVSHLSIQKERKRRRKKNLRIFVQTIGTVVKKKRNIQTEIGAFWLYIPDEKKKKENGRKSLKIRRKR